MRWDDFRAKRQPRRCPRRRWRRRPRRAGRSRRPRHRHGRRAGAARLGARHRSEPADQRRRDHEPQHAAASTRAARRRAPPAGRPTRWAASSAACWARPRIAGRKSSARTTRQYEAPRLVLFEGQVKSACGFAQSAIGTVLLPERQAGLSRHVVLPPAADPLPRMHRPWLPVRTELCDRARDRSSRAEPARRAAARAAPAAGFRAARRNRTAIR